jgi:hypothetical protein
MRIKVGDLVTVSILKDNGVVLRIIEQLINDYLQEDKTLLAEVYWQNLRRSKLELVSDLQKIN